MIKHMYLFYIKIRVFFGAKRVKSNDLLEYLDICEDHLQDLIEEEIPNLFEIKRYENDIKILKNELNRRKVYPNA